MRLMIEQDNTFSVDKCHKYWPEVGVTLTFGPITVENLREDKIEALNGLMMRTLKVKIVNVYLLLSEPQVCSTR